MTEQNWPPVQVERGILNTLHRYAPRGLVHATEGLVRYLFPLLNLRASIYELRGKGANGDDLVTLCVGESRRAHYLLDILYAEEPVWTHVSASLIWDLPRKLASLGRDADLVVVRVDGVSGALFFPEDYFTIPEWVVHVLTVPESLADIPPGRRRVKGMVRNRGFSPVVSHEMDDFEMFYRTMYVPYISRRFGAQALLRSFDNHRRIFEGNGGLLFVEWKGRYVAGVLYKVEGETFYFHVIGVKDGDFGYVERGGLTALFYFTIVQAGELGCQQVHFGGTRPFLDDGVFQHKKRWGMSIKRHQHIFHDFKLRVCNLSPAVLAFLADNPFVFRDVKQFSGLVLVNGDGGDRDGDEGGAGGVEAPPLRLEEVRHLHRYYWAKGLDKLYVFSANGFEEVCCRADPATLPPGIVLIGETAEQPRTRVVGTTPGALPEAVLALAGQLSPLRPPMG
jgi:hypothetical protein